MKAWQSLPSLQLTTWHMSQHRRYQRYGGVPNPQHISKKLFFRYESKTGERRGKKKKKHFHLKCQTSKWYELSLCNQINMATRYHPVHLYKRFLFLIKTSRCHFTLLFSWYVQKDYCLFLINKANTLRHESVLNISLGRFSEQSTKKPLPVWRLCNKFILCTNTTKETNTVTKQEAPLRHLLVTC